MSEYGRRWQKAWDQRQEARKKLAATYRELADTLDRREPTIRLENVATTQRARIAELEVEAQDLQ